MLKRYKSGYVKSKIQTLSFVGAAILLLFVGIVSAYPNPTPNWQVCVPTTTVYVGHSVACGKAYTVELADLGTPTTNGISPAAINVYYKGTLTNTTSVYPGNTVIFRSHSQYLYVTVNQTSAGLYAYQKWAKISVTLLK